MQQALRDDDGQPPRLEDAPHLRRGACDVLRRTEVLDGGQRIGDVKARIAELEMAGVHVTDFQVVATVPDGGEGRRVLQHRSRGFDGRELALSVDVRGGDAPGSVRQPEQNRLGARPDGQHRRIAAETALGLEDQGEHRPFPLFALDQRPRRRHGLDLTDGPAQLGVGEIGDVADFDELPATPHPALVPTGRRRRHTAPATAGTSNPSKTATVTAKPSCSPGA